MAALATLALLSASAFSPQPTLRRAPALRRTASPTCGEDSSPQLVEQLVDGLSNTSPSLLGTDEAISESEIGTALAALRVASGVLMIHHGSEGGILPANFGTPGFEGFVDFIIKPYFSFLPGDPGLWSALHDYVEFWGGILVAIGLLTRPSAFALFFTMIAAVYFHLASTGLQGFPLGHVENYSYNFEEPVLYALIFLLLCYTGAGPFSVDAKLAQAFDDDQDA